MDFKYPQFLLILYLISRNKSLLQFKWKYNIYLFLSNIIIFIYYQINYCRLGLLLKKKQNQKNEEILMKLCHDVRI